MHPVGAARGFTMDACGMQTPICRRANVLSQSWSNDKDQMVPHGLRWSSKFTLTVTVTVTTSILGAALCTIPQVSSVCLCVCECHCVCLVFTCIDPKQNCVTFALPSDLLCSRATSSLGFLNSSIRVTISLISLVNGFFFWLLSLY